MSIENRFVGRSGEKRFSTLCSDEGITCNLAAEDDHGWDHIVQFPYLPVRGVPSDLQRALPAIFVQTKSHKVDKLSVRMKLSNALALARSPNPCFVVIPPRKEEGQGVHAWRAFHVWDLAIAKILKRARVESCKGTDEANFNKLWITFRISKNDYHAQNDLLPWIEATVRNVGRDYTQTKLSLLDRIGFESDRLVGSVQFAPLRSIEELIDHQIGLTATIPIGKFELRDRRFGIDIPMPLPAGGEGEWIATMHVHPKPCLLLLRGPDQSEVEVAGELMVGSLPGLPIEECKFRVKADFFDLIHQICGAAKFNLKFATADLRSPAELERLARVLGWAGKGDIDVQVWMDDKRLFGGKADINPTKNGPAYERLSILLSSLTQLSSHLRSTRPQISIEGADKADDALVAMYGYLNSLDMNVAMELESEAHLEIRDVLSFGFVDVGYWRFGAITRWKCTSESVTNNRLSFTLGERVILSRYAFEASDTDSALEFRADFDRFASEPGVLVMDDNAVARLCQ